MMVVTERVRRCGSDFGMRDCMYPLEPERVLPRSQYFGIPTFFAYVRRLPAPILTKTTRYYCFSLVTLLQSMYSDNGEHLIGLWGYHRCGLGGKR
jgi:hypothetical protein